MAPGGREERRALRQRGAGNRKLENASFGFTFGGPSAGPPSANRRGSRSRSGSVQTRRTPREQATRKTPKDESSKRSSTSSNTATGSSGRGASKRATRSSRGGDSNGDDGQVGQGALDTTPSVTGKRKRSSGASLAGQRGRDADESVLESVIEEPEASLQPRSTKKSRTSATAQESRGALSTRRKSDRQASIAKETRRKSARLAAGADDEKENTGDISLDVVGGQTYVSNVRDSTKLGEAESPSVILPTATRPVLGSISNLEPSSRKENHPAARSSRTPSVAPLRRQAALNSAHGTPLPSMDEDSSGDELTPTVASRQAPSRRLSRTPATPTVENEVPGAPDELESTTRMEPVEILEISSDSESEYSDSGASVAEDTTILPEVETTKPAHKTKDTASQRMPPPPLPSTKNRSTTRQTRSSSDDKPEKQNGSIPVTVYRMYASSSVPDANNATAEIQLPPRPNPIDVLSQLALELTDRLSAALGRQSSNAPRASDARSFARKERTVKQYASALSDRLFELTSAVDTGTILSRRVRDGRREVARLREELVSVRRQRGEIAIETDRVRAEWEEKKRKWEMDRAVNEGVAELELAVSRGKALAETGDDEDEEDAKVTVPDVEGMLREVAGHVGNGGIVEKVRAFNGMLERAAQVLEGRF